MRNNQTLKKIALILCSFLIFTRGYYAIKSSTAPATTQEVKQIEITVQFHETTLYNEKISTEAETLGDLLTELVENDMLDIEFEGSATDAFGRYITSLDGIGESEGFWVYDSKNNETCINAEFCPGIDLTPLADGDSFTFSLINFE